MKYDIFFAVTTALLLPAYDYKDGLYLPRESGKARFGVIQTGLEFDTAKESTTQTNG